MSDLLTFCCHGYAAIPLIEACRRRGLFALLDAHEFRERAWLIGKLGANEGHFTIALEALESLGLVEKNSKDDFRLTGKSTFGHEPELMSLYAVEPARLIRDEPQASAFRDRLEQIFLRPEREQAASLYSPHGAVIVPLVAALQGINPEKFCAELESSLPNLSEAILDLFSRQGWFRAETRELTDSGRALLKSEEIEVVASWRPVLFALDDLLFGDHARAFREIQDEKYSRPFYGNHPEHESFAADLQREIIEIFNREPLNMQPRTIVAVNGDHGALLGEVFRAISNRTLRGQHLVHAPVRLVSVADNRQALEKTEETLAGLQHQTLFADIRRPLEVGQALDQSGLTAGQEVLHLRCFVDHLMEADAIQPLNEQAETIEILAAGLPAWYLDREGRLADALTVLHDRQRRLLELAQSIGDSRLLVLEAHAVPSRPSDPQQEDTGLGEWIHRLAHEHRIAADAFITLAAGVGLFNDDGVKRYPRTSGPCRISFHSFTRRDYIVRHAAERDLDRLCRLEALCWQHTQTPREQILARLRQYPQGQFVLEKDGKVLGVIYSQRIENTDALMNCNASEVHHLHRESGVIVQLLAVNIDPQAQNAGYGDQLLEFMLQRCSVMTGIEQIVGVTLCKNYDSAGAQSFEQYIQQQGGSQDPVLTFHQAHGARVVKAIPGYRPQDQANLSNGVLVAYDPVNRTPRRRRATSEINQETIADVKTSMNRQQIGQFVLGEAARLLGVAREAFDVDRPVMEMGLDSADLLKLQQQMEDKFSLKLGAAFFFEHSTVGKVISYLASKFAVEQEVSPIEPAMHLDARESAHDTASSERVSGTGAGRAAIDIAIVGISCKLPGGIETPDELWQALASGKSTIGTFPSERRNWPASMDLPGIDQGGFVADAEAFDAAFFRMSPAEAEITDPQQRMLLELAWACLEDAGTLPEALKGSNTGVFVGAGNCDYSRLIQEAGVEIEAHHGVGSSLAVLANRLSYFFDLSGPSLLIDTACSSSLVALHTAVQFLRSGECAAALVGGVNLICHPDLSIAYHKAGMLAPDGRCKVFDARANGYVRSEGAVMFLLKPLSAALAERDRIHAVIKGSATNHGGLAAGLTVPSPQKQSELLLAAWRDAGIAAEDLTYIEAHGTGTSLGDPIEIQGIQSAWSQVATKEPAAEKSCAIGSVKSNVGHLEFAAGIAGLLKIVLSMQHRQLPASINYERLNPKILMEGTPFHIQDRLCPWDTESPRLAAVSSFGSGGANAHVVVEEYLSGAVPRSQEQDHLFVMSAPNPDRLRAYVTRVAGWLEREAGPENFGDAIYTCQVGRTAMKHRLAVRVKDHAELLSRLRQWLAGERDIKNLWSGQAGSGDAAVNRVWQTKSGRDLIDHALRERDLEQLGILWTSGIAMDWNKCYEGFAEENVPRRISLPAYPFVRERHWIDIRAGKSSLNGKTLTRAVSLLHPLVHSNTSDLSGQRYSSTFTGEEFFLADHRVKMEDGATQKVLPGVAYLEIAHAAIGQAWPEHTQSSVLELRNTVWAQPIVVTSGVQIGIALSMNDNDEVDYEIYSGNAGDEIVHCQGHALRSSGQTSAKLDIVELRRRMGQHSLEPAEIYAAFEQMGIQYGPAHRAITALSIGEKQLLAQLRLPAVVETGYADFVLHPSLLDGALQAAFGLVVDLRHPPNRPSLPFALEVLRVVSPCSREMFAWVRYTSGSEAGDKVVKLDIDLCDKRGTVCVQMRGFSVRALSHETGSLVAVPIWESAGPGESRSETEYAEHNLVLCELPKVNAPELAALLPNIHCLPLQTGESKNIAQRYSEYALACFERIQAILESKPQGSVLVQIVAANYQDQSLFAGLSGLLKTASLENPRIISQLVLVPPDTTTAELARRLQEERAGGRDAVIRYEHGVRQVLRRREETGQEKPPVAFKDDGVYLITGGFGGLGVLFAKEILAQTRQARVVLTGRSAFSAELQARLAGVSAQAGRLSYRQADLGNPNQLRQMIVAVRNEFGRLNGIFHSAGMIADSFILKKTGAQFSEVLAPKVAGAWNLDQASHDIELDFFVLFSSVAAALGSVGQADYAAANGFMDWFAEYRNGLVAAGVRHGRTRSINWSLWQAGGMEMDATTRETMRQSTGMQPMQTATGMEAFHRSLALPFSQVLVAEGDLARMRRTLFADSQAKPKPVSEEAERSLASATDMSVISAESIPEKTLEFLSRQLAEVLKLPAHKIDPQAGLETYGIDSILAMKLTNQLEKTFGSLSKTLFFEYQSIRELSKYFVQAHSAQLEALFASPENNNVPARPADAKPEAPARADIRRRPDRRPGAQRNAAPPKPPANTDPIAIIGLSGRYPEAVNIEAYWRNLRDGKDSIIEVPKERWDWRKYFSDDRTQSGRHYSKWGGFIAGVDEFDPIFFNIAPREAKYIDPQERLFLQYAWMAVEDAGYTRASLQASDGRESAGPVGVYVGVMYSEYQLFSGAANPQDLRMGFAGNLASIANRVSYVLNLHGPSMTLDTMCSSSLTAIHVACQDLKQGRIGLAIAGGVNVSVHPHKYLMLSVGQFISGDGHCQSFGEGGDGYIPGEGVGAVVLKRLSDAKRDGDHIYGIIRGSALTHGGKTNGYTVPNPQAQTGAISQALAEAQIDARHISYIEAHGTGTKLGDPIEIAALSKAFSQYTQETGFCLIGSAKSNIGHCESAAGIAGLTKVLLQMQHREIVPSLHSAQLNPHIDFLRSPFVVNQSLRSWEPPVVDGRTLTRVAGISSFGAGGSNAHMIVEEYQQPTPVPMAIDKAAIVLSARTPEQLRQKAGELLEFVRARLNTIDLAALTYTLQVGREGMEERLGLVVNSIEQLAARLQAWLAGEQGIEDSYQGQVRRNKEALSLFGTDVDLQQAVERWIAGRKLSKLLDLWAKGLELDWSRLYGEARPARMSLPTYPFARNRYWIDTAAAEGPQPIGEPATAVLHPLLHRNTSDLSEQRYSSTFTGKEFFFGDHQGMPEGLAGQKVLPEAAYPEMARVAIEQAMPSRPELTFLELRSIVWGRPFIATDKKQINVALLANDRDRIGFEIYSKDGKQDVVHCQGHAVWRNETVPALLDLERLRVQIENQNGGQSLTQLQLPKTGAEPGGAFVLHPGLLESALQACAGLTGMTSAGSQHIQSSLESLCIFAPCTRQMFAWIRHSTDGQTGDVIRLDIDLCDEAGNISSQIRGLSRLRAAESVEHVAEQTAELPHHEPVRPIAIAAPARKEIAFILREPAAPVAIERKPPARISLTKTPTAISLTQNKMRKSPAGRPTIQLSNKTAGIPAQGSAACDVSPVKLFDDGNGIFSIQIAASAGDGRFKDLVAHLLQALERARQESSARALMLHGIERCFLREGREDYNEAVAQGLFHAIVSFPWPVVAVLQDDTRGAGLLLAALCDFIVCNEDANYRYTDAERHFYPTAAEAVLFDERFGTELTQDFLYAATSATGRQLRTRGWTCPMVPASQVEAYAWDLASALVTKSAKALRLLKGHLSRHMIGLARELKRAEAAPPATARPRESFASTSEYFRLETPAENVLVINFAIAGGHVSARDLIMELDPVLARARQSGYKAVVLAGDLPGFSAEPEQIGSDSVVSEFLRLIADSEIPVVAALDRNATGNAWLIAQICEACVYGRTGLYSFSLSSESPSSARMAAAIFTYRFGNSLGQEILLSNVEYSGADLLRRAGALHMAEQDQVTAQAVKVAESWAALPQATLLDWKKQTSTALREKIAGLPAGWEENEPESISLPAAPTPIALHSKVISAVAHPEGIVAIRMEDRQAKNMFSDAFMAGLREVFAHIERTPAYKVVILTGYDSYFSSGGTKESLLAVQEGRATFTDFNIFELPLKCPLPVIAALQGHGIGAGWALGMFADVVLLSEESMYMSPYMNYGFTPGAGATWVLADKMGPDLARESLLTGRQYAGSELRDRGLRLRIMARDEVYPAAMALARRMAQSSRSRLIGLKRLLTQYVEQPLAETYRLELAMHEETFVGQADTLARIQSTFVREKDSTPMPAASVSQAQPEPETPATENSPISDEVLPAVATSIRRLLANELQMREIDIDDKIQFIDLGLDSISGVTWVRKINEKYRTSIEATIVYSHPTLSEMSRHVMAEAEKQGTLPGRSGPVAVGGSVTSKKSESPRPEIAQPTAVKPAMPKLAVPEFANGETSMRSLTSWRSRPASRFIVGPPAEAPIPAAIPAKAPERPAIAVIGMAGQFPQAKNLEEFWQNIAQGRNCISPIPPDRWDVNTWYQPGEPVAGRTNSPWVGALEEYDRFDPLFFNISPTEAESMDPQQRVFLQACWHSIENAGYDARMLSGSRCGVFVGCTNGDYHQLSRSHQLSAQGFTGNATSILAARISYFLNLQGPCISIDTACSSSLVALACACDSLVAGGSDLALAGGVYVMAGPEMHIKSSQAGMLSPEGKCFTFDQRADGFVPGEGVGVVLLKRLADAQRDRDMIYGVIEGWGLNQDGKTNGITAPNPESQTRLEQQVYDKYGIDPAGIQLIEAHGTGTKLGDPIEVEGLKKAFKKYTRNKDYCALGSVKSNIGHCATAAGVAGFLKLILALKHRQLPPTINFERLNEHIDLNDSPFYVNSQLREWELNGAPRRQAAISSFGFSGTNAHVVVGEYLPPAEVRPPVTVITQNSKIVVPLSARQPEQLRQKARDLRDFIRREPAVDLQELAYTLQVGREAMEERVGFLVSSTGQLAEKLEAYVEGETEVEDLYQSQGKRSSESIGILTHDDEMKETVVDKWIAQRKLSRLLDLWVRGLNLDWDKLYGEAKPQRMELPVYPFAKERYWIDAPAAGQAMAGGTIARLHPLLHRNTSDLREQRYASTFTGEEFFLTDHRVRKDDQAIQSVLPGVAYLEMARAAIGQASPEQPESGILELRNTVWLKPIVVTAPRQVSIALLVNDSDEIGYEVCSIEGEEKAVHCQGEAVFVPSSDPVRLDVDGLKTKMDQGRFESSHIYKIFSGMGLHYGPAHRGIAAIELGKGQLLAQLHLPSVGGAGRSDYVLHPGMMDSALQTSIGLIADLNHAPDKPVMPFVLESVRILSACAGEMLAWTRYSQGSGPEDKALRLDIDLCDREGVVCVQMRGLVSRVLENAMKATRDNTIDDLSLDAPRTDHAFDDAFYQKLFADVLNGRVSVDEAADAG